MTLLADISHVFGKKVRRSPLHFLLFHACAQGAEGIIVAKTRQTVLALPANPPAPPRTQDCKRCSAALFCPQRNANTVQVIVCLLDLEKLDIRSSGEAVLKLMKVPQTFEPAVCC